MWKLIRNRNPATSPRRGVALQSLEGLPSHVVAGAIASRACDCKKEGSRKRRQKVARFGAHFTQIIRFSVKPKPNFKETFTIDRQRAQASGSYRGQSLCNEQCKTAKGKVVVFVCRGQACREKLSMRADLKAWQTCPLRSAVGSGL
jgi:hypothetical protein